MNYTPTTVTTVGPAALNINELPTLAGSEKQVTWASTIRAKAITLITEWMHDKLGTPTMLYPSTGAAPIVVARQVAAPVLPAEKHAEFRVMIENAVNVVIANASAKWWIDNRDATAQALVKMGMGK